MEDKIQLPTLSGDITDMIGQYFNMTNITSREQFNNDTVHLLWRRLSVTNGIYASQAGREASVFSSMDIGKLHVRFSVSFNAK